MEGRGGRMRAKEESGGGEGERIMGDERRVSIERNRLKMSYRNL